MISVASTPPGPPIGGRVLASRRDPFGPRERTARARGDIVHSRFAGRRRDLVRGPRALEHAPLLLLHAVTVRRKQPVRLRLRAREVHHG